MTEQIAFIDLAAQAERLGGRIESAIARVLAHGQFIMGPEVSQLEKRLSAFCGARHAVSCANGTDALVLALMAIGIKPKDAVFVPSFTFVATAEAPAMLGATPVFIDVLEDSFNLDPAGLERGVSHARRLGLNPRAVIPVDLFGLPADYAAISAIAESEGLAVVADAAQSFGASCQLGKVGTLAPITATSFFPAKPLGCYGDGGAVFLTDDALLEPLASLRVHGKGRDKYDNVRIGLNSRLDTIQAAILLEKLDLLADEIVARQAVAQRYRNGLGDLAATPAPGPNMVSAWAQYTLRTKDRDKVAALLKEAGVPTAVYYPTPLHAQSAYREFPQAPGGLPVSERLSREVLSLPMHPYLSAKTQERIIAQCRKALGEI